MAEQNILKADSEYTQLDRYLRENNVHRMFLVCDSSIAFLRLDSYFRDLPQRMDIEVIRFSDFSPNPLYESVVKGVDLFRSHQCDLIVAIGGGSAMDVAKCIKLYSNMDPSESYLKQTIVPNSVLLLAIPTTAGTGSEATRYAVIYEHGEKQSITHESCIPSTVLMDPTTLKTLPEYQKKSTMLDALCHAIESFWSVHSTEQSKEYSRSAIHQILANQNAYLNNEDAGNAAMLQAANLAGKAINITQTTAGHAMCYKLTSLYGIAHGHAAALCVSALWPYMLQHVDQCIDPRGEDYLNSVFADLAQAFGCDAPEQAAQQYQTLLNGLSLQVPQATPQEIELLASSVNPVRLKNHPVALDHTAIRTLYQQILGRKPL